MKSETRNPKSEGSPRIEVRRAPVIGWVLAFLVVFVFAANVQAQVTAPVFMPPSGTRLPVTVVITNATAGSSIYYTLDGTVPDTNSVLYTAPLGLTNYAVLRARAFASGQSPSDPISAVYLDWTDPPGVSCARSVTNDVPEQPLVSVQVSGVPTGACFSVEEQLPALLQASAISAGGVYIASNHVIRWGPWTNEAAATVEYRLAGLPGMYPVEGSVSVDGAWTFNPAPSQVTVQTVSSGPLPSEPPQVAAPAFTPASGGGVPVTVTITDDTPGASIYFTLDGTLPTTNSTRFSSPLVLTNETVLRARAFTNGWTPSVASVAYYGPPRPPLDAQVARSVDATQPSLPGLNLEIAPGTNAACFALEEWLPRGLAPLGISSNGVYDSSANVIRWGPFFGSNALPLNYHVVGPPGNYTFHATWSVDGQSNSGIQGTNVVLASGSGGLPLILVNGLYARERWLDSTRAAEVAMFLPPSPDSTFIWYSLDGNEPYLDYTGSFAITESCLIRAALYDAGYNKLSEAEPMTVHLLPLYPLTNNTPGGGAVLTSPNEVAYFSHTTVALTATNYPGWTFMRWEGDVSGTNATNSIVMDGPKSMKAVFGTSLGTNVVPPASGYVTPYPAQTLYPYGGSVCLSAVPTGNYYFGQWQNAATGQTNTPLTFVVTHANTNVTARFYPLSGNNRSLAVIVNGEGTVTRSPYQNYYTNGASVLLSAMPTPGQPFQGWGGDAGGTNNPLSVLMNGNKVITATFGTNTPSANQPPSVSITNPADGAVFTAPANVIIQGDANDADGTITQVRLFAGTNLLTTLASAAFSYVWTNAPLGTNLLTAVATDNGGASSTSAPVIVMVNLPPLGPPIFSLSSNQYSVVENGGSVTVTVRKSLNSLAGTVNYTTLSGSAVAVSGGLGDYYPASGSLSFTTEETSQTVTISIVDDLAYEGDQQFSFALSLPGSEGSLGSPATATISIIENDPPVSTNSLLERLNPGAVPRHDGQLRVSLLPASAGGQWRLVWETAWRNSGAVISGMPGGNYEVEFKPATGYLPPGNTTNPVVVGSLTSVTNQYVVSGTPQSGSLSVLIEPAGVGGRWRLQGETVWLESGFVLTNVLAGPQIVEFKSVADRVTPTARVIWVEVDQLNSVAVTYLVASATGATLPGVLQFDDATTAIEGQPPFGWTGQLLSETGYGSGTVVRRRVVLTAAHVVFNDATLSYVPGVRWFFQRYADEYEPPAQSPRGWYVFSGYAAARTNDASPGVSSPASQNLDVATLYFLEDAGRGGQSGYLVSEPGGTEWLQASALKSLLGYPVEMVSELNRGKLHATLPGLVSFASVTNRVFGTAGIRGYPGMSGGPLCVKHPSNVYYPAAVYLGGSGQTMVRAIDGAVADLINRADVTANTGDNNTGGGVVLLTPGAGTLFAPGYLQVVLGPPEAVAAGAGWRISQLTNTTWYSDNTATYALPAASYTLVFRTNVAGWQSPANRALQLAANQTAVVTVNYTRAGAVAVAPTVSNRAVQLTFTAPVGQRYALERSTNLSHWQVVATNPVLADGMLRFSDSMQPSNRAAFYRVRFVP